MYVYVWSYGLNEIWKLSFSLLILRHDTRNSIQEVISSINIFDLFCTYSSSVKVLISNLYKWYRYINKMKYQEWKRDVNMNFRHEFIMTTKISPSFLKMILNIKSSRCRNDDHDKQDMLWNISLFIYASRWKM